MILNECLLYEELTEKAKIIVNECMDSLLDTESVKFQENGIDYEIYIADTKCPITNENYYVLERSV